MINNSVGITSGTDPARFFYPVDAGGMAASLFTPPDGRGWLWPVASVLDSGVLRVFAWRVEKSAGAGAFGFKAFGTALAEIDNHADEPTAWRMRWRDVPVPPAPESSGALLLLFTRATPISTATLKTAARDSTSNGT